MKTMEMTHDAQQEQAADLQIADAASKESKITIKTSALLKAVQRAASIVNHGHSLAVLQNVYFSYSESGVTLRAANDHYYIETYIAQEHCVLEGEGRDLLLPAKRFLDIISKLSGSNTTLVVSGKSVRIKSGRAKMDITSLEADEFPAFPTIKKGKSFEIDAPSLLHMYTVTEYATSKLQDQPVLTGVCHDITKKQFRCIATDRHRFSQNYHPTEVDCEDIRSSVPTSTIKEVMKHLKTADNVTLTVDDSHVIYNLGDVIIFSRVLEGSYPDTDKIIPVSAAATITIPNSDFLGAVKRAAIFLDESGSSKITIMIHGSNNQMRVQAVDSADGTMLEDMTTVKGEGDFGIATMNGRYLLDALSKIAPQSHIQLKITPKAPVVIREMNALNGDVAVVVPVKHANDKLTEINNFMPSYDEEVDPFAKQAESYAEEASEAKNTEEDAA